MFNKGDVVRYIGSNPKFKDKVFTVQSSFSDKRWKAGGHCGVYSDEHSILICAWGSLILENLDLENK